MNDNEIKELIGSDIPKWIEHLLYDSLFYEFIQKRDIFKAKQLLLESNYISGNEFFDDNYDSTDKLILSLVNATQI